MKQSLTQGLEGLQASEIEVEWQHSQVLRRRLVALLNKKQEDMLKKRRSESVYDSPNWSLLQADAVGYERAMSEIISLLE